MDPALIPAPLNVPNLLRQYHLSPRKSLGQNFLVDHHALEMVVDSAGIQPNDHVLEIGAGLGSLTRFLARAAQRVVAVEIDHHLLPILQDVLRPEQNVELVLGDILKLNPVELMQSNGYQVVANIPYYITSAIIRHLLEADIKPSCLVLTIQKEVAQRICAAAGDLSLLALSVQVYGDPHIVAKIPAGAFYPPPTVDSAVIRVDLFPQPIIPMEQLETFFRLAKAGFGQKRKMLRKSLSGGLPIDSSQAAELLSACGIDPTRRAETVTLYEWKTLTQAYLDRSP